MTALRYVEATLSLNTSQYASGDVLAATQEVPLALRAGQQSELRSVVLLDKDDQGVALDLLFLRSEASVGTENAAVSVTDAAADEILGAVEIAAADYVDLVNSQIVTKTDVGITLSLDDRDSTSLWIAAVSRGTGTYTAAGITLKLGLRD